MGVGGGGGGGGGGETEVRGNVVREDEKQRFIVLTEFNGRDVTPDSIRNHDPREMKG